MRAAVVVLAALALAAPAAGAGRPDLAAAEVTADRLCVGDSGRVEVAVVNLGDQITDPGVEVVLTVQVPELAPDRRTAVARAIAPGQTVRIVYDAVGVRAPAEVLLRVEVDPGRRVDDPDRRNNTLAILETVVRECGGSSASRPPRVDALRACPLATGNDASRGDARRTDAAIHW